MVLHVLIISLFERCLKRSNSNVRAELAVLYDWIQQLIIDNENCSSNDPLLRRDMDILNDILNEIGLRIAR